MRYRELGLAISLAAMLVGCGGGTNAPRAVPADPVTNDDGTPVTDILTASFDPSNGVLPFPNDLLFSGTTDLTLNAPAADPTDLSDPAVALNALDGFSTTAPASFSFSDPIDASTVVPGGSVRVFEVTLTGPGGGVTGVVRELMAGVDFVASVSNAEQTDVAVVWLSPLDQLTTYLVVVTDSITDQAGNQATPSQTFFLTTRTDPLVDQNGNSTDPLLPDSTAQDLEPLRQLTNSQLAAAAGAGIAPEDVVLSYTFTTQSITPVLTTVRALAGPASTTVAPTGLSTAFAGLPGTADIFIGTIDLPYYLTAPSAENPTGPLDFPWMAIPGNYVAPFDSLGLDPTSTNVTVYNPIPQTKSTQTVPLLLTLPNASSGMTMPAGGWPTVIYMHGITRDRTDAIAIADTMASIGYAVIAIDHPLHGVTDPTNPLFAGNTPFAETERTFNVDYVNNDSGAPGPDGNIDSSGTHFINLQNLLVSRDNLRQSEADLGVLAATVPTIDFTGDGAPDLSGQIRFVGMSLGAITGIPFFGAEDLAGTDAVSVGTFNVPGGQIAYLLNGSDTFGPRIRAGLAAAGVQPGTPDFNQFLLIAQTVVDSADPINWASVLVAFDDRRLVQEVFGDTVIPNRVANFPLAGTEPLLTALALEPITDDTQDAGGIQGATRFTEGSHGSLLDPTASQAATAEMQTEAASMTASGGSFVDVVFPDILTASPAPPPGG